MQISVDKSQLNDARLMLKGIALDGPKIISRSLNKTAAKGKVRASQEIRKQVNLKATYVKSKLIVKKASSTNLIARITANSRGIMLARFSAKSLKKGGVSVKVKPKGKTKKISNAFLTTVNAGGKKVQAVAVRDSKGGKFNTGTNRIKILYGPSVSQVFNTVRDLVDDELMLFLEFETAKQIATALRGY